MRRKPIQQLIFAAVIALAIFIPGFIAVNAGTAENKRCMESASMLVDEPPCDAVELTYYSDVSLPVHLQDYIIAKSRDYGLDPAIIMAMIQRESRCNVTAIGDDGQAFGLMQIHPRWHYKRMLELGCTNLHDGYQNVTVGMDYLAELRDRYGDITKALVAYNQGSYTGTVTEYAKAVLADAERIGGIDVFREK